MTNGTSQRCKLAFIRHRQVPRGKLVRAPPPVGHTDKVPCMRDTLSDFCAEHTISTTSQPNMSLLSSLPTVDTARTNKQINSTGLSAGLSLSGPSGQSLINNDTAFNVAAKPEIYLSKNNAKETKPVHSQHSDMIPEKSTHSGEQSVDAKNADVKAIDIESYHISFQDVVPSLIKIDGYLFYKIYQIGKYCSTGVIVLPPSEIKDYANTNDNILLFYVVQGDICVTVNHFAFMIAKAGHFVVPRGSTYQLANNMDIDAILYFTHIIDPTWFQ